jgi:hypothetical protein
LCRPRFDLCRRVCANGKNIQHEYCILHRWVVKINGKNKAKHLYRQRHVGPRSSRLFIRKSVNVADPLHKRSVQTALIGSFSCLVLSCLSLLFAILLMFHPLFSPFLLPLFFLRSFLSSLFSLFARFTNNNNNNNKLSALPLLFSFALCSIDSLFVLFSLVFACISLYSLFFFFFRRRLGLFLLIGLCLCFVACVIVFILCFVLFFVLFVSCGFFVYLLFVYSPLSCSLVYLFVCLSYSLCLRFSCVLVDASRVVRLLPLPLYCLVVLRCTVLSLSVCKGHFRDNSSPSHASILCCLVFRMSSSVLSCLSHRIPILQWSS